MYVPTELPTFSREQLVAMQGMSYPDLAYEIVSPLWGTALMRLTFAANLGETYAEFRHPAVAPLSS